MTRALQERFDALLEDVLASLPEPVRRVIEEVPVVVEDRPSPALLDELRRDGVIERQEDELSDDDLLGLHSGIAITEGSVEHSAELPGQIHVFREGIVEHAGGWDQEHADERVYDEIRITLLHEIGHHFGLDEDDLDRLGYA